MKQILFIILIFMGLALKAVNIGDCFRFNFTEGKGLIVVDIKQIEKQQAVFFAVVDLDSSCSDLEEFSFGRFYFTNVLSNEGGSLKNIKGLVGFFIQVNDKAIYDNLIYVGNLSIDSEKYTIGSMTGGLQNELMLKMYLNIINSMANVELMNLSEIMN